MNEKEQAIIDSIEKAKAHLTQAQKDVEDKKHESAFNALAVAKFEIQPNFDKLRPFFSEE